MPPARPSYASRRLRRTLSRWAADVSGLSDGGTAGDARVIWAEQNLPRPELPYISLRRLTSGSVPLQSRILLDVPTTVSVTVLTTTVGESAAIALNYGTYRYRVQVGDDLTAVRDGLIAALEDGPDPLSVTPTGAASFEIESLAGTVIHPVVAIEGTSVVSVTLADLEIREGTRTTTVRVESFGFDLPDERALDYADALVADLGRAQTAQFFSSAGVGIVSPRPAAQDTSALSGGERETRAFFDLQVAQWTRHMEIDPSTLEDAPTPDFQASAGTHLVEAGL